LTGGATLRIPVLLPKWGMTMHEGTLAEWMLAPGESVNEGDVIACVETEKAVGKVQAPASGRLVEILVYESETVETGTVIAYIEADTVAMEGQ
jgi:pyruvate/2-oxoglutarate dehydrogenase complex dihydrolipoamide acyltransferase (E2) component